jgi:putative transposase
VSRFQFVDDTRTDYPVKRLCEVLKLNRSSYYKWKTATPARTRRTCDDALLAARITVIFNDHDGCYGAKRVTAELNDLGDLGDLGDGTSVDAPVAPVNHKRVARLMKENGLAGFTRRRRVRTTVADPSRRVFADLVNRRFTAESANQTYVGDITYLPISDGSNMYLATVIDCFSRRLVGFAIADHMRTSLVVDALTAAAGQRGSLAGAIFHSDHGSVYTSGTYQKACRDLKVRQSMGTVAPLTCSGVNSAHTDPLAPAHRRAAVHPRAETPRLHRLHPRRVRVDDHRARRRLHRPTDIHGTGPTGHHRHRLVDPARTPHPTASPQSPGPATRTDPRQHRHDPGRRRSPDQRDPSDRQRLGEQVPGPRRAGGCGPCLRRGDHQFLPGTVVRGDSGDSGGQYR